MNHSDYIVYVDESGDHSLVKINPDYPIFVLVFCVFKKSSYIENIVPKIQQFKFNHFGHDIVVLHEHEIRKEKHPFNIFKGKAERKVFLTELTNIIESSDFEIIACVIDKQQLALKYSDPGNPYDLALTFGLERLHAYLAEKGDENKAVHVVVERRGKREDEDLELVFRRICDGANYQNINYPFQLKFAHKQINSVGLQLADLVARPIGLSVLKPEQANRAFAVVEEKFYRNKSGDYKGLGLKHFP